MRAVTVIVCSLLILAGCNHPMRKASDVLAYVNEPANGLVRQRTVGGFQYTMRYLPPHYLALNELQHMTNPVQADWDSLCSMYDNGYTFLMTLGPDEEGGEGFDIMYVNVATENDYKQRVSDMNFHIGEYIDLHTASGGEAPVLSRMENSYGLQNSRKVYLVFEPQGEVGDKLDITFTDELFDTGISHFVFRQSDLDAVPAVVFENIER